jgi:ketosteroid isomerase-like protein
MGSGRKIDVSQSRASSRSQSAHPFGIARRQRRRERRPALLVASLCLSLVTGIALVATGAALTDAGPSLPRSGHSAANADLVRDFYAAVNRAIETGDATPLDQIVTPDATWCLSCPNRPPTRDGLKLYLAALHRATPDARLAVESVVAGVEGTVVARVLVTGYPLVAEPAPWGPVDTFRMANGWIAERRSGPDPVALVDPLAEARLDALPPAVTGVALARLTFSQGSGVANLLSAGPTLLVVETGEIAVHIASRGRVLRARDGQEMTATRDEDLALTAVLRQGDGAIVPAGVRYALHQHGTEPAEALGTTLFYVGDDGSRVMPHCRNSEPCHAPWAAASETASAVPPPEVRLLASGKVGAWPAGPVRLAIGRIVLGPGARIAPFGDETALIAVDAGTLGKPGDDGEPTATETGLVRRTGSTGELHNTGDGLLILLALTVAPVAA